MSLAAVGAARAQETARNEDETQGGTLGPGGKHGLGAAKSCQVAQGCVGDTPVCTTSTIYLDDFGDAILITESFDIVDPSGAATRVPANPAESLPIQQLLGNAVAIGPPTAQSPLGTFPVLIGPPGSTYVSPLYPAFPLPGTPATGIVQVISNQYVIQPGDPSPLFFETQFKWQDQCDMAGGGGGCDPVTIRTATASAGITIVEPMIDIQKEASISRVCEGISTPVTYTYTVTAALGDSDLENVVVTDDMCGPVQGPFGDDGDNILRTAEIYNDFNMNGMWDPGEPFIDKNSNGVWDDDEVWTYTCTTNIDQTTTNTATATANAAGSPSCTTMDQATLMVPSNPRPSTAVNDATVCQGQTAILSANASGGTPPYTYLWNPGGQTTPNINVGVGGVYCVVVTDSLGCSSDEDCGTLTVNPNPSVSLASAGVCESDLPHTFCPVVVGGTPPYTYLWSTGETTECIDATIPMDYAVIVTDSLGCQNAGIAVLTVNANPTAAVPDAAICQGTTTMLCANPAGGTPPYTFSWSPGGQTTECITVGTGGVYTATVTDANGCTGSDSGTVTVNPNPTANVPNAAICQGTTTMLCANPAGGTAPYTFSWSPGGQTTECITVGTAGVYTVTVTDANGCTGSDPGTVTVNPNPTANVPDASVCQGDTTMLCANPAGGTPPYTYSWSPGGQTTMCITVGTAGMYTVTVTDANGCTGSDSGTLTVVDSLTVDVGPDTQICQGSSHMFCAVVMNGTPPFSYQWNTGATTQCITVGTGGIYSVTVTDANGCTGSDSATLTVVPNPFVMLNDADVCEDDLPYTFCPTVVGGTPPYTYMWSPGGETTQCIDVNAAGNYSVTVTDANGCMDSDSASLTVQPAPCGDRPHPGWNWVDNQITLTGDQPVYWSALTGHPAAGGLSPFPVLDPGFPPGRPAMDGTNDRVLRGFIVGWAENNQNQEINWNHIAGNGTIVNYRDGYAWEYNTFNYRYVGTVPRGAATGTAGMLNLDGIEFEQSPALLLFDFQAVGSSVFSGPRLVTSSTDLTLYPVSMDLRQNTDGPVTTKADFDIWNMNEVKFSGTHRCITCWDQTLLGLYGVPNHFLLVNLQTDHGKARVDGVSSFLCDVDFMPGDGPIGSHPLDVVSEADPLLGVIARLLTYDAGDDHGASAVNLTGMGLDPSAVIRFNSSGGGPPPEAQAVPTICGATEKGSIFIFSKVELRWDQSGNLIQDTFLSLTNDYPESVRVQMYFVNGDPPLAGTSPAMAGPGESIDQLLYRMREAADGGASPNDMEELVDSLRRAVIGGAGE